MVRGIVGEIRSKLFVKGTFIQNISWTMSGNVVIIATQLIFSPILTRIYGPEAYGSFTLFNAIAVNISNVACLQYDKALILPKSDREFNALLRLCLICIATIVLLMCIAVVFIPKILTEGLGMPNKPLLLFGLPILVAILSLIQISNSWILRKRYFKDVIIYGTSTTVGTRLFNLAYGIMSKGAIVGIALGEVLGKAASVFINYFIVLKKEVIHLYPFPAARMEIKAVAKQYQKFPLFDMPATWLNVLSGQLPVYLFGRFAGVGFLGFWGLATSLLEMPVRLLAYSLSSVFTAKATELEHESQLQAIGPMLQKLYWTLLLLSIIPFAFLVFWSKDIFMWIFGMRWEAAGQLAAVLAMYTCSRMVVDPFLGIYRVMQKQHRLLLFQIVSVIFRSCLVIVLIKFNLSPIQVIGWFAFSGGLMNVLQLADLCILSRLQVLQSASMLVVLFVLQFLPFKLLI